MTLIMSSDVQPQELEDKVLRRVRIAKVRKSPLLPRDERGSGPGHPRFPPCLIV